MSLFQNTFEERARLAVDRAFGVTIDYQRGADSIEGITATWERIGREIDWQLSVAEIVESRAFRLSRADLVIGGTEFEPRQGDQITLTESGNETVWELGTVRNLPPCEQLAGGYQWLVRANRVA